MINGGGFDAPFGDLDDYATVERVAIQDDDGARYTKAVKDAKGTPPTLWAPELAKAVEPIAWVSKQLTIAPGRPSVFAGEGGTRKGWFAMDLMLCTALGLPMFGRFATRQTRTIYLDFEQTERISRERFQLLAKGREVDLSSLGQTLGYRWRPVPTLAPRTEADHVRIVDELCWHTEGIGLALVDSVRACSRGIDENSVFASGPLDLATEVSEKTGVCFAFLDHAGKPDPSNGRARKHTQRGHSSKLDAGQSLLVFSAVKGEPTLVTCDRAQALAESEWPKDFQFTLAPSNGGLQLQEVVSSPRATNAFAALKERILDAVRRETGLDSKNAICSRITGANKTDKLQAIDELVKAGKLAQKDGVFNVSST